MKPSLLAAGPLVATVWFTVFPLYLRAQQPGATPPAVGLVGLNPYTQARTPTLTVPAGAGATSGSNARLNKLAALAGSDVTTPATVQAVNGLFSEVSLGYLDGSGKPPAPATVTLQFDASVAGTTVWVQPMDGGAILSQDASGKPVSLPGGTFLALDATGAATLSFQAPARTGRFQVLIRCQNVSSTLPFVVLDPSVDN